MPQGLQRDDQERHGKQPYQAAHLASGVLPDVLQQEGHQLPSASPTLGVTYKTAWFLTHRIREAMRAGGLLPRWVAVARSSKLTRPSSVSSKGAAKRTQSAARLTRTRSSYSSRARRFGSLASTLTARIASEIMPIIRENIRQRKPSDDRRSRSLQRSSASEFGSTRYRQPQRQGICPRRCLPPTRSKASFRSSSAA